MSSSYHLPVLCQEVVEFLISDPGGVYVDGTVGGGGHAGEIVRRLSGEGMLVCFDADADAIDHASRHLAGAGTRVKFIHANVRRLRPELSALTIAHIRGILLDLGVSSFQIDEGSKGFSFRSDDALDMRLDRRQSLTAREIVNGYSEADLAELIFRYGEEHHARRIARRIIGARPLETTGALASVVASAVGDRFLTKSLARVFQALRIVVNDELESLKEALAAAVELLEPGGRIVVLSYHSLEDRIVKEFFRAEAAERVPSGHKYLPDARRVPRLKILTKKPLRPTAREQAGNPRARSAKLRVAERVGVSGM